MCNDINERINRIEERQLLQEKQITELFKMYNDIVKQKDYLGYNWYVKLPIQEQPYISYTTTYTSTSG